MPSILVFGAKEILGIILKIVPKSFPFISVFYVPGTLRGSSELTYFQILYAIHKDTDG